MISELTQVDGRTTEKVSLHRVADVHANSSEKSSKTPGFRRFQGKIFIVSRPQGAFESMSPFWRPLSAARARAARYSRALLTARAARMAIGAASFYCSPSIEPVTLSEASLNADSLSVRHVPQVTVEANRDAGPRQLATLSF